MDEHVKIGTFETEWQHLLTWEPHGSFVYDDPAVPLSRIVDAHFRDTQSAELHGVYIIRQRDTRKLLRVGKAGTITRHGNYKRQAVPGRLKNVKGAIPSNQWFADLFARHGPLQVEYVLLPPTPRSAAYIEALLLQSYLNEHACLPPENDEF